MKAERRRWVTIALWLLPLSLTAQPTPEALATDPARSVIPHGFDHLQTGFPLDGRHECLPELPQHHPLAPSHPTPALNTKRPAGRGVGRRGGALLEIQRP